MDDSKSELITHLNLINHLLDTHTYFFKNPQSRVKFLYLLTMYKHLIFETFWIFLSFCWSIDRFVDWSICWLIDLLVDRFVDLSICRLIDLSICRLIDWLVDFDWSIDRFVDWSIDRLIDYAIVLYYCKIVSEYKAVMTNC